MESEIGRAAGVGRRFDAAGPGGTREVIAPLCDGAWGSRIAPRTGSGAGAPTVAGDRARAWRVILNLPDR